MKNSVEGGRTKSLKYFVTQITSSTRGKQIDIVTYNKAEKKKLLFSKSPLNVNSRGFPSLKVGLVAKAGRRGVGHPSAQG